MNPAAMQPLSSSTYPVQQSPRLHGIHARVAPMLSHKMPFAQPSCSYISSAPVARQQGLRQRSIPFHPPCAHGPGDMGEMYKKLLGSAVFQSPVVQQEFINLFKEVNGLSEMASKFPDFDLEGKKMYLERMQDVGDRYEVFMRRLELSDDPGAREYLRFTNAQMLNGGFSLHSLFQGLRQTLVQYRQLCDEEEKVIADPMKHQRFTQGLREMWAQSALGRLDLKYLKDVNPDIMNRASSDPKFYVAMKEISNSPTSDTLAKWMDDPNIGPLVAEMWKSMQRGS